MLCVDWGLQWWARFKSLRSVSPSSPRLASLCCSVKMVGICMRGGGAHLQRLWNGPITVRILNRSIMWDRHLFGTWASEAGETFRSMQILLYGVITCELSGTERGHFFDKRCGHFSVERTGRRLHEWNHADARHILPELIGETHPAWAESETSCLSWERVTSCLSWERDTSCLSWERDTSCLSW